MLIVDEKGARMHEKNGNRNEAEKFKERTGSKDKQRNPNLKPGGMTRRRVHHTSRATNLRFACIRSASAGVGAGAGVRNASSGDLLATVFVGLTCNRVLETLGTGPGGVEDGAGPAVLSAEPPIAVGS